MKTLVNNYSRISFNFGPTLLQWMKKQKRRRYIILSWMPTARARICSPAHGFGHRPGPNNHTIVPLSNARDQETQVLWGIRDFEYRFERKPEGMWLPETAVNTETLEVLATHGIKFTILSPYQAKPGAQEGHQGVDQRHGRPGGPASAVRMQTCPRAKKITLFFYDGPVSQGIAFEGLLNDGEAFANRLIDQLDDPEDNPEPQLMHIATDGESYGHHPPLRRNGTGLLPASY